MNKQRAITSVVILGALAISALLAYLLLFAPANFRSDDYLYAVASGQTVGSVVDSLKEDGIVRSELGTKIAFRLSGVKVVKAGTYNLSPRMDVWQIASIISKGETSSTRVTIPEGYTNQQIADTLQAKGITNSREFVEASKSFNPEQVYLKDKKPNGHSWEGYLFPDTYNFDKGAPAADLVARLLQNFDRRIEPHKSAIAGNKYSLHQILTLASLVEKEGRTTSDRNMIAGVLFNRLDNNMRLDVDATVRFITNNWDKPITQADLNIDSPYNTRKRSGIPPGPICNPGLVSLQAVLSPTPNDYLYYLTDNDGVTHFAKTLDEHNQNKQKYLQ